MEVEKAADKVPLRIGGIDIKTVEMPRWEYPIPVRQGVVISSERGVIMQSDERIQPEE